MKRALSALIAALTLSCGVAAESPGEPALEEETGESPQALGVGPTTLAFSSPVDLIASTGNLYWTSYAINEFGPDSATVFRAHGRRCA